MSLYIVIQILLWFLSALYPGERLTLTTYGDASTLNAGVLVYVGPLGDNLSNRSCGYEIRGEPGFFCDVN